MAYEPHTWVADELITHDKLNHMETGIANAGSGGSSGGVGQSMAGKEVNPTVDTTVTAEAGAEIFNDYRERTFYDGSIETGNVASGMYSHAEGFVTTASGRYSHAEGSQTTASANYAHAEGSGTIASGSFSHAEGVDTTASGSNSHAEGGSTVASEMMSHAEGNSSIASGLFSHAGGTSSEAKATDSFAHGDTAIASADEQTVFGTYNVESTNNTDKFIVGNGTYSAKSNCFRVTHTGVFASGAYNSSGADYAELFEWADNNPANEDRRGLFVTLDGERIRIAKPGDKNIIGIVSGNPTVLGDVYDDQWQGMYMTDVFGSPIWEDVEVPDQTEERPDPENPSKTITEVVIPAHTEHRQKLNPNYDNTQKYKARTERPEWAPVGLIGKLVAVDDGTCEPGEYCTVGYDDGVATASTEGTRYYVMSRIDNTHIRVFIKPC